MIPKENGQDKETKRLLSLPCGCESRKEIMGAGDWKNDAIVIGAAVLIPLMIFAYFKWGKEAE